MVGALMIPITSGLSLSLVWSGSTVVPLLIYDTVEPCGSVGACVFSFFPPVCPDFIDR